jgi:hypothetical protein
MTVRHDAELEQFKRSIDLLHYATNAGYALCPGKGKGFIFLEHPNRDRIVVTRTPSGYWLYASINAHEPGPKGESLEHATRRLRECIAATRDKGSIVEFVLHRDWSARQGDFRLEMVRERLREYQESGLPLAIDEPLGRPDLASRSPPVGDRAGDDRRAQESPPDPIEMDDSVGRPSQSAGFAGRRYEWVPPPLDREPVRGPGGRSPEQDR